MFAGGPAVPRKWKTMATFAVEPVVVRMPGPNLFS